MMISGEAFVMLLSEPFFKTFTKQALCDTKTSTEGLFALSCENRAEVDDLVKKARLELLRPRRPSLGSAVDGSVSDSAGADRRHAPVPVEATPRESVFDISARRLTGAPRCAVRQWRITATAHRTASEPFTPLSRVAARPVAPPQPHRRHIADPCGGPPGGPWVGDLFAA